MSDSDIKAGKDSADEIAAALRASLGLTGAQSARLDLPGNALVDHERAQTFQDSARFIRGYVVANYSRADAVRMFAAAVRWSINEHEGIAPIPGRGVNGFRSVCKSNAQSLYEGEVADGNIAQLERIVEVLQTDSLEQILESEVMPQRELVDVFNPRVAGSDLELHEQMFNNVVLTAVGELGAVLEFMAQSGDVEVTDDVRAQVFERDIASNLLDFF